MSRPGDRTPQDKTKLSRAFWRVVDSRERSNGMVWKPGFIRAMRSFLQGCLAVFAAFALWLGAQSVLDLGDLKVQGSKVVLGLLLATTYAVISFIQNVIEDTWGAGRIPKG